VLVRDVLAHLAELGYGHVDTVVSAQESLIFSLPTELRRDLKAKSGIEASTLRHEMGSLH